jgi:hypothetical protein
MHASHQICWCLNQLGYTGRYQQSHPEEMKRGNEALAIECECFPETGSSYFSYQRYKLGKSTHGCRLISRLESIRRTRVYVMQAQHCTQSLNMGATILPQELPYDFRCSPDNVQSPHDVHAMIRVSVYLRAHCISLTGSVLGVGSVLEVWLKCYTAKHFNWFVRGSEGCAAYMIA